MRRKPSFVLFVLLRFVAIVILLFVSIVAVSYYHKESESLFVWMVGSLTVAAVVLIWLVYGWAKRIARDLQRISRYLERLEYDNEIADPNVRFFTQEFDAINRHLLAVLKEAKKRDEIKQRYTAKLRLKNRQRADMLSAIAHEFRNPIAAIMGYSQTLVDEKDLPEALRIKFLGKIYDNGAKIESLLGRLVLWNKFESGETTLKKSRFDMCRLVNETVLQLQERYKNRKIDVVCERTEVEADRTLMEVVLKNLIENALKYSDETVRVEIDENEVRIIDKGVGIAPEELDKITKKFYRSKTHTWDNSMGLGLSIVKTILKLHDRRLDIRSRLKEGSVFSFELP